MKGKGYPNDGRADKESYPYDSWGNTCLIKLYSVYFTMILRTIFCHVWIASALKQS